MIRGCSTVPSTYVILVLSFSGTGVRNTLKCTSSFSVRYLFDYKTLSLPFMTVLFYFEPTSLSPTLHY